MKTKYFAVAVAMLFACTGAKAQEKSSSITIGFAPIGSISVNQSLRNYEFSYDYESYWNASIGYEKQLKGVVSLTELTYAQAKSNNLKWPDADLTSVTLMTYAGKTFNRNKRLQIPVYIGIGGEYFRGGPLHNLAVDLGLKARVKFYITNHIALFGGVTGRFGLGTKKTENSDEFYSLCPQTWALDAGLIFGI